MYISANRYSFTSALEIIFLFLKNNVVKLTIHLKEVLNRVPACFPVTGGIHLSLLSVLGITFTIILSWGLPGNLVYAGHVGFAWTKAMGGNSFDQGNDIFVDTSGNIYTTGDFENTVDFDPGPGTFNLTSKGVGDIFISKLDNSGNLLWAKAMGDTLDDFVSTIFVDSSGNVYTTGSFQGTVDFDPGPGTLNLNSNGEHDIFISKLDNSGNLVWARAMGGNLREGGSGIFVDSSGNVYTIGSSRSSVDFDPGPATHYVVSLTNTSYAYISKLNSSGNFLWVKTMSSPPSSAGFTTGASIFVDVSGNIYTTGSFEDTVDFDTGPGTFNLDNSSTVQYGSNVFVSKLDSSGNFVWAKGMGGISNSSGTDIFVDTTGNIYTTGRFADGPADFDPGAETFKLPSLGDRDTFISKLDSSGDFVWAKAIGGTIDTDVKDIFVDLSGNVYTTGSFTGTTDFDPGTGSYNLHAAGDVELDDAFISKLDSGGKFIWAKAIGGDLYDSSGGISVDSSENVFVTGSFQETDLAT
jgi:hypothetical protein